MPPSTDMMKTRSASESSESSSSAQQGASWRDSNEMPKIRADTSVESSPQFMQLDLETEHGVQFLDNRTLTKRIEEYDAAEFHDEMSPSSERKRNLASRLFRSRKSGQSGDTVEHSIPPRRDRQKRIPARKDSHKDEKRGIVDRLWNFGNASFGSLADMSAGSELLDDDEYG